MSLVAFESWPKLLIFHTEGDLWIVTSALFLHIHTLFNHSLQTRHQMGAKNKTPGASLSSFTTAISTTNDGFRCVIKRETHKSRWLFFSFFVVMLQIRGEAIIKPHVLVLSLRNKQLLECLEATLRGACRTRPVESLHKTWSYLHCSAVTHFLLFIYLEYCHF